MAIVIGGRHNNSVDSGTRNVIKKQEPVQSSLEEVRRKALGLLAKTSPTPKVVTPPPKKVREASTTLIDYKQSSFISDMLQSDKD
jgi:hypothetical protein